MFPLGKPITRNIMLPKSVWELKVAVNGYKNCEGNELATQAINGRFFEILEAFDISRSRRVKVRLLEDGYICWMESKDIENRAIYNDSWQPNFLSKEEIKSRLPKILKWVQIAAESKNEYLWGGTFGPNYDCSGLVQCAYASEGIWLPRDAYQQEKFCRSIDLGGSFCEEKVEPGDLVFFGSIKKCTHVGIYQEQGLYWHSSGKLEGRNGIGVDQLHTSDKDPISTYYRSRLRGIGRVECCHNGSTLLR